MQVKSKKPQRITRIGEIVREQGFCPDNDLYEIAEIVVKECAKIIAKEPFNAGEASKHLRQHFGIE